MSDTLRGRAAGSPPVVAGYAPEPPGTHPPLDHPDYRSTALRFPRRPLVPLPHRLTEVTGPLLGEGRVTGRDHDLTVQHGGEPLGPTPPAATATTATATRPPSTRTSAGRGGASPTPRGASGS